MKEEVRKERDQANGRDFKSRDKRNRSPRRDRSRSPMEKRNRNSNVQAAKRVYVANIPFDVHWHEVKVSRTLMIFFDDDFFEFDHHFFTSFLKLFNHRISLEIKLVMFSIVKCLKMKRVVLVVVV